MTEDKQEEQLPEKKEKFSWAKFKQDIMKDANTKLNVWKEKRNENN